MDKQDLRIDMNIIYNGTGYVVKTINKMYVEIADPNHSTLFRLGNAALKFVERPKKGDPANQLKLGL